MNKSQNKIKWYMLSFMCFSTLWAFGNVLNGFIYFNGIQVVFSWVLMFALYFVPYALMVGELGSAFKNSGGGVSSWVHEHLVLNLHTMLDGHIGHVTLLILQVKVVEV